jgi:hypothetical protein
MNCPIIFIHYGDSPYLKYTLKAARKTNKQKRIILLGDDSNRHLKKYGIEHYFFKEYEDSDALKLFDKNFRIIAPDGYSDGKEKSGTNWTSFVFRRLFIMSQFVISENINRLWIF